MLENAFLVADQVAILFVLMAVGGAATKLKWLGEDGAKQMTNLVLYFSTPCIAIKSFYSVALTPELAGNLVKTAVFAVLAHLLGILVVTLVFRREPQKRKCIYRVSGAFPNCGFMGIPLASAIVGPECVIYASIYIAIFYVFQWTYGVLQYEPGKKPSWQSMLLNTGTVSLAAGFIVAVLPFQLPQLVIEPVNMVAALNSPIAMIVLGYYLFSTALRPQKGEGGLWIVAAVKLLFIPAVALVIVFALGIHGTWLVTSLVLLAAPSAVNALLFAARFNGDTALAARVVSIGTLFSLVTLPVVLGVALIFA